VTAGRTWLMRFICALAALMTSCILFNGVDDPTFPEPNDAADDTLDVGLSDADAMLVDSTTVDSVVIDASDSLQDTAIADAYVPDGPKCPETSGCIGDSCCVPGGKFSRSYDGVTAGYTSPKYEAVVSDFRLDKYEVTVARFRPFVAAVIAGFKPAEGSGKHKHVNGGAGLNGGTETGWSSAWNTSIPSDAAGWGTALGCSGASWTADAGTTETLPINCVNWYQAYAFCIWDGGFLPTEAEWNYAAAGGSEQRKYPWGATEPGSDATFAIYGCHYKKGGACSLAAVGSAPAGTGRWGHADLAGNIWEWTLDVLARPYSDSICNDCAFLKGPATEARMNRGGGFNSPLTEIYAGFRGGDYPDDRFEYAGFRCARAP
jgi:formylglycine-generating enzyme